MEPPTPTSKQRRRRTIRISRDVVLFTTGILGVLHETILAHSERPSLLFLFAAMMGLPAYFRKNGI